MMAVTSEINVYEHNGTDLPPGKTMKIRVLSHWNKQDFVVLEVGDTKVTVHGGQLYAAITNARNTVR